MFGTDFKACWRSLYKLPVEKRTADLQWRLMFGAIATNRHVAHLNPAVGTECLFCGLDETVNHLLLIVLGWRECLIFNTSFYKIWREFFSSDFYKWSNLFVSRKEEECLLNFLLGSAKLSIWKTRKINVRYRFN